MCLIPISHYEQTTLCKFGVGQNLFNCSLMQGVRRALFLPIVACLLGCGANGSSSGAASSDSGTATATVVSQPAPSTPMPTTPAGTVVAAGLAGEADIPDNFDTNATLEVASQTVPVDADPVGAFRFTCLSGQLAKDDPIVYPGQPGKSHLHQFFGNTLTNANTTYQSLRTSGGSTCTGGQDPTSQRSAYWMPAMLDGAGNAVKPNRMLTYYKQLPNSHPDCGDPADGKHIGFCIPMPNGLRFINGFNMATGKGGPADLTSSDQWQMGYDCWVPNGDSVTPSLPTIAAVVATGKCTTGSWLRVRVDFPACWDGKNLDSPDHRSHMSPPTGALTAGGRACPSSHPYNIPTVTMQAYYTVDANFTGGGWHLASDEMTPGTVAGSTLHADYWEAWSPVVKAMWQNGCINGHLSCNNGELGNGKMIKGMSLPPQFPDHVLVPLATIP